MQTPRTEFAQALKAVATERGLDAGVILETIKQAIVAAYRRDARERGEETEGFDYEVQLNPVNGEARIFAWPVPVVSDDAGADTASAPAPSAPVDKKDKKDVTPPGFGRIAAQTAKQVIHQKIREAEKGAIMDEYSIKVGNLIPGMVLRFDGSNVRVDLGRTEGLMPAEERIPTERLNLNQRLTFLLKEIRETPRGKELILSRADPVFVEKLFAREVPEIGGSNSVQIKAIAREPGVRTKIAVFSAQPGVDPVGSCVGQKGVRVQAVTNELGGERVDIIPWTEDTKDLIAASLAPAANLKVKLNKDENLAIVEAPETDLSMAIGKDGQNARLAAKLTGWRIEVVSSEEKKTKKEKSSSAKASEDNADEKEEKVEEKKEVKVKMKKVKEEVEEEQKS